MIVFTKVSAPFHAIWKEFYESRGGEKPLSNRNFPAQKTLALIEELFDTKWKEEEKSAAVPVAQEPDDEIEEESIQSDSVNVTSVSLFAVTID
jgi:hypothetical protein